MLHNLSISGEVIVNNKKTKAEFVIYNLTNIFVSKSFESENGYYNTNLTNFPNNVFNTGDLIMIRFQTRENGIDYVSSIYYFIDKDDCSVVLNTVLEPNWIYNAMIQTDTSEDNIVKIRFMTTKYQYIWYILYIDYNGVYKELDKVKLTTQEVTIGPLQNGKYKLLAYVVENNNLLCYADKIFEIKQSISVSAETQVTYFEWE